MNITNNIIVFDDSDISQLSPLQQGGLSNAISLLQIPDDAEPPTPAEYLSTQMNGWLDSYASQYQEARLLTFTDLGKAIVSATPEQQSQIQPLIEQAQTILGVNNDNG